MAIPPTPPVTQPPIAINNVNDPLYIASSDHLGMVLTNTPFNGTNFDGWSRNVKMALGAKLKLGFIDGTCNRPSVDNVDKQRWIRCDYMKLQRDMGKVMVLSFITIASFFNKLKRCWDELQSLNGLPTCNCGKMRECTCSVIEKFIERDSNSKLIQFLIKLSDGYEYVRSQILAMDPLPSVNKAFYIVQQIEKQKQITNHAFEPTAFFASMNNKRGSSSKRDGKNFRNDYSHEVKRTCTHYNKEGHTVDQYFEKIGYPDWYKGKMAKKSSKLAAHVSSGFDENFHGDIPFDMGTENEISYGQNGGVDQKLVAVVCQEMMKIFQGKSAMEDRTYASTSQAGIMSLFTASFALFCHSNMDIKMD
ncbi:pyridoxal 5'-phosphate synthase-like subunit PDX1.2 [Tanacetum coccineum]